MESKDLKYVAEIFAECELRTRDGLSPLLDYIKAKCKEHHIEKAQGHIMSIVALCTPVYNTSVVDDPFDNVVNFS